MVKYMWLSGKVVQVMLLLRRIRMRETSFSNASKKNKYTQMRIKCKNLENPNYSFSDWEVYPKGSFELRFLACCCRGKAIQVRDVSAVAGRCSIFAISCGWFPGESGIVVAVVGFFLRKLGLDICDIGWCGLVQPPLCSGRIELHSRIFYLAN